MTHNNNISVHLIRAVTGKKALWLSLFLAISLIATSCSLPGLTELMPTSIISSTEPQPSPTIIATTTITQPSPTVTTMPVSIPPELREFLQSGKSVSEINPDEFTEAREAVNRTFAQLFGEAYYASHQRLVDYYKPQDISKLELVLANLVNLTNWEYTEDHFDCSEMTALTEYALEAAGFETLIITSVDPTGSGDPNVIGHAWCIVVLKTASGSQLVPVEATAPEHPQIPQRGKKMPYKSKGKTGSQTYDEYVTRGWVLDNIYEAFRYLPDEFDWWNSAQINRSWFK